MFGYSVPEDKRVLGRTPYEKNIQRPPDATLPLSVQAIATFPHTATNMNTAGSAPYLKANDNIEPVQTASIFYGGAITEHLGAYAQFTYNAQPFGPPVPHLFTWDNLDVRYANTTALAGMPLVYGLTVNNNPTASDPWNSTPARVIRSCSRTLPTRRAPRP
jgi:hypothetical protein